MDNIEQDPASKPLEKTTSEGEQTWVPWGRLWHGVEHPAPEGGHPGTRMGDFLPPERLQELGKQLFDHVPNTTGADVLAEAWAYSHDIIG
ncbi:MAG TPA: hypothetical protein VK674_01845 [Candidatus Limnocylindria bacterium]|nr:hypothetical protein [Candidatus Limnocylindria bacterium]